MSLRTDAEILLAAQQTPDVFGAFYRRHAERVLQYFATRTANAETAADLMAETFASAFASLQTYRPGREPAIAWLFTIARNLLIDAYRHGQVTDRARRRLALQPVVLDDDDVMRIDELASLPSVERMLDGLSADERSAIHARIVEERSYDEIAQQLRCSSAVVRQRVSRGLARLRTSMEVDS